MTAFRPFGLLVGWLVLGLFVGTASGVDASRAPLDLPMQVIGRDQKPVVPATANEDDGQPAEVRLIRHSVREKTSPEYQAPMRMPDSVAHSPGLVERTLMDVNQTLSNVSEAARGALAGGAQ